MKKKRNNKTLETYDIWDDENVKEEGKEEKVTRKIHPSEKRNRKLPLPHPGQSYNPHPEDHERLLKKILKNELEYQKKQEAIERAVSVKVDKDEIAIADKEELLSGIKHLIKSGNIFQSNKDAIKKANEDADGSSTDEAYSDYDDKDFKAIIKDKKVVEKRKSKKDRTRRRKDLLIRKAAKIRKAMRMRANQFDQLKKMTKELDKIELCISSLKRKIITKAKNERIGPKVELSDPIYCLKSELPSSLRQVNCPMNAIVREKLESFQSRHLVEPTKFQVKSRKYKKRFFTRETAAEQEG